MRSLLELDEDRFAFKAKARAYTDRPAAGGGERLVQKECAAGVPVAAIRAATETALLVPELQFARLEPFMSDNVMVENRTFDEIEIGESASLERTVTKQDIELYATVSGDANPTHLDEAFAKQAKFKGTVAHSMLSAGLISSVLGNLLPGAGTVYLTPGTPVRSTGPCRRHDHGDGDREGEAGRGSDRAVRLQLHQPGRADRARRRGHGDRPRREVLGTGHHPGHGQRPAARQLSPAARPCRRDPADPVRGGAPVR